MHSWFVDEFMSLFFGKSLSCLAGNFVRWSVGFLVPWLLGNRGTKDNDMAKAAGAGAGAGGTSHRSRLAAFPVPGATIL